MAKMLFGPLEAKVKTKLINLASKNVYDDIDVFGKEEDNENTPRLSATTIEEVFNQNLLKSIPTKLPEL